MESCSKLELSTRQKQYLISLYQSQRVLWDTEIPQYKDAYLRAKALEEMQNGFFQAYSITLSVDTIRTKIASWRASMSRDLARMTKSKRSGAGAADVYKPKYDFFKELTFLLPFMRKRSSDTNIPDDELTEGSIESPVEEVLASQQSVNDSDSDVEDEFLNITMQPPLSPQSQQLEPRSQMSSTPRTRQLEQQRQALTTPRARRLEPQCQVPITPRARQIEPQSQTRMPSTPRGGTKKRKNKEEMMNAMSGYLILRSNDIQKQANEKDNQPEESESMACVKFIGKALENMKSAKRRKLLMCNLTRQVLEAIEKEAEEGDN